MCGIIGIIGKNNVTDYIISALKRLEYRGYDSAGIALLTDNRIECRRAEGKLLMLEQLLTQSPILGNTSIGHTRWATHGRPSTANAHPHCTEKVAVVHNGIIENFQSLRAELQQGGTSFSSETDSEVIPHLITHYLNQGFSPRASTMMALNRLEGSFAIVVLFADKPHFLIAARRGSPLLIGHGDGEMYIGSDILALTPLASHVSYLEDGDIAELYANDAVIYNQTGEQADRTIIPVKQQGAAASKGNYRHFMLKEIHEQPDVLANTVSSHYNSITRRIEFAAPSLSLSAIEHISIVACGTSYYAGLVAKYWLEKLAGIPVTIDIASEYRYREMASPKNGVALFISQSGETADTLAALKFCRSRGQHIISLVNVAESSMAANSDTVLHIMAGPEIGVASTKAFTAQLLMLACLSIALAEAKGLLSTETHDELGSALTTLPSLIAETLLRTEQLEKPAHAIAKTGNALYIGRGTSYPLALEGALKLKELTYIHAEGIAAGELKHGPIALIDEQVPVVIIAPSDHLFDKTASNLQEVAARGGKIILISDKKGLDTLATFTDYTIEMPETHSFVTPILYSIPLQLLAYHVAILKGTDVDQPRNLAKSVTVE